MALTEDISVVEGRWLSLTDTERDHSLVLLRGLPHSAKAREEWNEMAYQLGVDANALIRVVRSSGS